MLVTNAHPRDPFAVQSPWTIDVLNDEGLFRAASIDLVAKVRRCWESNDSDLARELMRSYAWLGSQCLSGWRASAYDNCSCQLALEAAFHIKDNELAGVTLSLIEAVYLLLSASDERRKILGEKPRPCTQVRLAALNLLGDCKWAGPAEYQDLLQTPAEMVEQFFLYDQRIRDYITAVYHDNPQSAKSYLHDLLWTANTLAKVCLRFCPAGLRRIIAYIKEHYGPALTLKKKAYQHGSPSQKMAVFFWDFEIAKLWNAYRNRPAADEGLAELEAMDYCHKQRNAALNDSDYITANAKEQLREGWLREWRLIRRDLLPDLEVI